MSRTLDTYDVVKISLVVCSLYNIYYTCVTNIIITYTYMKIKKIKEFIITIQQKKENK